MGTRRKVRVGCLVPTVRSFHAEVLKGFRGAMQRDSEIEWEMTCYFSHGPDQEIMHKQARIILEKNFEYVLTVSALATKVVAREMDILGIQKPTIFIGTGYPIDLGIVASYESSGGSFTGIEMQLLPSHLPLDIASFCFPEANNILVPYLSIGRAGKLHSIVNDLVRYGEKMGISVTPYRTTQGSDIRDIKREVLTANDALLFVEGCMTGEEMPYLKRVCGETKTLIFASGLSCATIGAASSYGAGIEEMGTKGFEQMRKLAKKTCSLKSYL